MSLAPTRLGAYEVISLIGVVADRGTCASKSRSDS
jgi:hypothetical protein